MYPSVPLTRTRCPSRISRVACSTPTTAGKPYSRAITAPAWARASRGVRSNAASRCRSRRRSDPDFARMSRFNLAMEAWLRPISSVREKAPGCGMLRPPPGGAQRSGRVRR
jgi:hypothetical protein